MRSYFRYFWLITRNWNILVAVYMIYHEIRGRSKYKIDTMDMESLDYLTVRGENKEHGSFYQASAYSFLEKAFDYLANENVDGAVVDYGAGKGRILIVAAHFGYKKIRGIEFAPELCTHAKEIVESVLPGFRGVEISVLCMDAVEYKVQKEDVVFFFFNPFKEAVMLQVVKNILKSVKEHGRKIYVVYLNPVCADLFLSAGFVEEYHMIRLKYIEMAIYSLNPGEDYIY